MKFKSKIIVIILALIILGAACTALFLHSSSQSNVASASSLIETYTAGKNDVKLTVGVFKSGGANFKLYGADAKKLEPVEFEYDIGSISKTFTASLLCKAIDNGLLNLDNPLSKYLPLDSNTFYPTILSLATHTSGYGEYPFDSSVLSKEELEKIDYNFNEKKLNIYQGINREDVLDMLKSCNLNDKSYGVEYSNFGFAVLGTVLGEINDTSFKTLAEDFIQNDLCLNHTRLGNGTGNLNNYWTWNDDDTYFAAGGFVSTVTDLLKYGQMNLIDSPEYLSFSHKTYKTSENDEFSMGLGWIIDPEKGYIWHNGGTSAYDSFIGIDKEHQTVVVVLSNYAAKDGAKDEGALDILGYTLLNSLSNDEIDINNVLLN